MKRLYKILLATLLILFTLYLFRGGLYRLMVSYKITTVRVSYTISNDSLSSYIKNNTKENRKAEVRSLTSLALKLTSDQLNYCATNTRNDPNTLITHRRAHCVGYAAFAALVCNQLFTKFNLHNCEAKPVAGQIYFLGMNVHPWFNTPFFADHDFVLIENKNNGERLLADPTVNDYLDIDFVTENKY